MSGLVIKQPLVLSCKRFGLSIGWLSLAIVILFIIVSTSTIWKTKILVAGIFIRNVSHQTTFNYFKHHQADGNEKILPGITPSIVRCSEQFGEIHALGPSCELTNICVKNGSVFLIVSDDVNIRPWLGLQWASVVPSHEVERNHNTRAFNFNRMQFRDGSRPKLGVIARRSPLGNHIFEPDLVLSSALKSNIRYRDELLIPVSLHAAGNAGHVLWDTLAPALGLAYFFGQDPSSSGRSLQFLVLNHCEDNNDWTILYTYSIENCHRYVNGFLNLLSSKPPIFLSKPQHIAKDETLCFSHGISGYAPFIAFLTGHSLLSGIGHRVLRDIFYSKLGLNVTRKRHGALRLTIQIKRDGKNGGIMQNREEIEAYVKEKFVSYKGVPIQVNTLHLDATSIDTQIRTLAMTDIYFSTAGSGLYMSSLLPDNAIAIGVPKCYFRKLEKDITSFHPGADGLFTNDTYFTCATDVDYMYLEALSYVHVIPLPLSVGHYLRNDTIHYNLPISYLNETLFIALEEALLSRTVLV